MSQFARGGSQPSAGEELDYLLRRLEICGGFKRRAGRSRMNREVHVRFCEGVGVKFPRATRPLIYTFPPLTYPNIW